MKFLYQQMASLASCSLLFGHQVDLMSHGFSPLNCISVVNVVAPTEIHLEFYIATNERENGFRSSTIDDMQIKRNKFKQLSR
jgi:hypothetical protein